jgi:ABC-type sugar transport system permease subunit
VGRRGIPRRRRHLLETARPYLYVLPALLFAAVFVYWPLVQVGILSGFNWNMVSPQRTFVGAANYGALAADADYRATVLQSVQYVGIALLGNFVLPLGLALLTLRVGERHAARYQALLFTPTVVATSVGALLWLWIYSPAGGLLNAALGAAGLPGGQWLTDPDAALTAVGLVGVWKFFGFSYLIALAGLQAVPRTYVEAARVDGADGWPLLRGIVLPLLAPTLLFLALTAVLQALPNVFVPIQVLTQGGPAGSSSNVLYGVYETAFRFFQVGKASAEAVVTLVLFAGAAFLYFRLLDRRLEYDR